MITVEELQIFIVSIVVIILGICSYSDLKKKEVDNRYSFFITFLSIPLITFNNIYYINIIIILTLFILYFLNSVGAADIKVLVPLIAMMTYEGTLIFLKYSLLTFIIIVVLTIIKNRKFSFKTQYPFFPAIFIGTCSYLLLIVMNYIR